MRLPDASLWIRNTLFVKPRGLAELERQIALPPEGFITVSKENKHSSSLVARVQAICKAEAADCAPKTLAAHLASLERRGGCGAYGSQADLVEGVLAGGGCCSDVVKTYLLMAPALGFSAREVHIPSHTTAEIWNETSRRWIWIDPFIGYQAFGNDRPLSHLDVYQRFAEGKSVQFSLIQSTLSSAIRPTHNYPGYRPAAYQAIFYTPAGSLERSTAFGDLLAGTPLTKPIRELLLYLMVKPPLLASASGFNLFLLLMARAAALAWLLAWFSSSLVLIVLGFDRRKPILAASQRNLEST